MAENVAVAPAGDDLSISDKKIFKEIFTRSWFCVFNNPEEHGYSGEPKEILERLRDEWCGTGKLKSSTRSCAFTYCVSAEGLHHVHMVLEDTKIMRFSRIKSSYAIGTHFEVTKGNKKQAEDYINKVGKFEEKDEKIIEKLVEGEIKGRQGHRSDLDTYQDLIDSGLSPKDIFRGNLKAYNYENFINRYYFQKRCDDTPVFRKVNLHWLFGETGTCKSYKYDELCAEYGEDNIYLVDSDYKHAFDYYNGEKILFIDEYRGQFSFSTFLTFINGRKSRLDARYYPRQALWTDIYVTSPNLPQELYNPENINKHDSIKQLYRRITDITYAYYRGNIVYHDVYNVGFLDRLNLHRTYVNPVYEYIDGVPFSYNDNLAREIGNLDDYVPIINS